MPYHKNNPLIGPSIAMIAEEKKRINGTYGHERHAYDPPAPGPEPEFGSAIRKFEERQKQMSKIDYTKAKELYDTGLSDGGMAEQLGCSGPSVCMWRKKHGLKPNHADPGQKKPAVTQCVTCGMVYNNGSDHVCPKHEDPEPIEPPTIDPLVPLDETEASPEPIHVDEKITNAFKKAGERLTKMFPGNEPIIPEPSVEDYLDEIAALQEDNLDLMIKNAELFGYSQGVKDTLAILKVAR